MSDLTERICTECPARAANNCPYANFPHLKRKCEYRSDVMYGYELAEKDLALTWEDIPKIIDLWFEVATDYTIPNLSKGGNKMDGENLEEYHCKEVLKRFKQEKEKEQ